MISAKIFLKILAKKDLLPSGAIHKLERQLADSPKKIPAEAVAKRLIKKGYLTPALAKRLLKVARTAEHELNERAASKAPPEKPPAPEESELGLAAVDEESGDDDAVVDTWEVELEKPEPPPPAEQPKAAPPAEAPIALDGGAGIDGEVVAGEVIDGDVVVEAPSAELGLGEGGLDGQGDDGARLSARRRKGLGGLLDAVLPRRNRRRKENPWDSSLILIGGGALLVLVLGGLMLSWLLFGQSGDQMLDEATEFYRQGSYTNAIAQYDQFLKKYPGHARASLAKVERGLARLRKAVNDMKDPVKWLEVAEEVLGEISGESAFGEAKGELKALLPEIASKLSEQAREKADPNLVAKTREAVAMVEKYISRSQRPKALLDDIAALLQITERAIARDDELAKAIAAMDEFTNNGEPERAYNVRRTLLKAYPDLIKNKQLQKAVLKVSKAQQGAVKVVRQSKAAELPEPAVVDKVALAVVRRDRRRDVPGAAGYVVYALAEGAAYGLDAATGRVLWRRFVGYSTDGSSLGFAPIPVSDAPGSDVLVVDARRQALVRLEAATGRVRWQQTLGEAFSAHPVLDKQDRILIAAASGRLVIVDLASGNSPGFIQIPQKLTAAPVIDPRSGCIYQVAAHSNLYVLSPEGECKQVAYLAHEPGTVTAAPVIISRLLVVAENRGFRSALLRVFALEGDKDNPPLAELQQIEIEGHVDAPPLVSGTRMLATTDSGRVVAYRVSGTNARQPLEQVAQLQTSDEPNLIRFPLLIRDEFWVADNTLTKYELQSSLGNIRSAWTGFSGSAFLQPLGSLGRTIFFVRRRMNLPGVQVAAIGMNRPIPFWETTLAAPSVGQPWVTPSGRAVHVVTALGSLLEVPADELKGQRTLDRAVVALQTGDLRQAVSDVVRMPGGSIVLSMGAGSDRLAVFDPRRAPRQFRSVRLNDPLSTTPVPMEKGLLVPCRLGQVYLLDPNTGRDVVKPFQAKLAAGQKVAWRRPVPIDQNSVVLADGSHSVYRLTIKSSPARHVAAVAEATLARPIASQLAVVGDTVYAVDEDGQLQRLRLPNLTAGKPLPLGAQATWGPHRAGQNAFLTTENEQLLCLDGTGEVVWKVTLTHGPLAGPPLPVAGDFLVAYANGVLSRVEGSSGRELGKLETGRPLGAGPVLLGADVLLVGGDGTLYLSPQPPNAK